MAITHTLERGGRYSGQRPDPRGPYAPGSNGPNNNDSSGFLSFIGGISMIGGGFMGFGEIAAHQEPIAAATMLSGGAALFALGERDSHPGLAAGLTGALGVSAMLSFLAHDSVTPLIFSGGALLSAGILVSGKRR